MFLQAAAGCDRARRVNRAIPLLDAHNFPVHIYDKRRPVCQERLFVELAILLHHHTLVIGQHRKRRVQFFRPMSQGRDEIPADRQYLRVRI